MISRIHRYTVLLLVALVCGQGVSWANSHAESGAQVEYQIKAGFIFNFLKFITFPEEEGREEDVFRLGVLGDSSVLKTMRKALKGKSIEGRPVEVSGISSDADLARMFHVIFVPAKYTQSSSRFLKAMEGAPVLVVGEELGFARKYGMIGFVKRRDTLRFEINPYRARNAGLVIQGQLASLAELVEDSK